MAIFTVTTDVNADTLTVKAGSDTYNINGLNARVTFDGDTRNDLNGNTSAATGSITPSSTLGGSVAFDGTGSWLIPYDTGSGNVPAIGTTISKGSASGKLVGVYDTLAVAPTAAGAAMPADGFIKVKQWNGTLYGTGALTGLTANAIAGEKYGWVEFVTVDGAIVALNRINQLFGGTTAVDWIKGKWFVIGTTDGSRSTSYQIPSNGVNQYHPGVFVDSAAPVTITSASWSGGTATVNATAHGLVTGQTVIIDGCTPIAWNVTRQVTVVSANQFTVSITSDPGTLTVAGTTSIPEFYPMTDGSALITVLDTTALRGKWCWIDTSGLLRFGNDGTNSTGGYVPPSGRVIRIGNIFMTTCTSAAKTQNAVNTTYASRPFVRNDTGAGTLTIDRCSFLWRSNVIGVGPTSLINSGFATAIGATGPMSGTFTMLNCGVGSIASSATTVAAFANITGGMNILDCVFGAGTLTSNKANMSLSTCYDVTMKRCKIIHTGDPATGVAISTNIGRNLTMSDITYSGGSFIPQQWVGTNTVSNLTFYMSAYGKGQPTSVIAVISVTNQCINWTFDGFTTGGLVGQGGRSAWIGISNNSNNLTFKNFGTADAPIDFRDANGYTSATWTRVTTTATVTKVAHGLKAADWIICNWSSDTAAITAATLKNTGFTIIDADTFSFTCLNAGAASGTLGYEYVSVGALISGAGDNVTFQNVHGLGHQAGSFNIAGNNAFNTIRFENVTGDPKLTDATVSGTNMVMDSAVVANRLIAGSNVNSNGTDFVSQYMTPYNTTYSGTTVAWARSTTTATITSTAHGLVTNDRVYVSKSSDAASIVMGFKTVTVTGADTFTFTCLNAGGASGTLDYKVPDGRIALTFNEGTATNTHYTVDAGTDVLFTGTGGLSMPTVNDQVTYTMNRFTKGFDTWAPIIPQMSGGTITDYDITYDIDTGSGFSGSFANASYPRAGGGGSSTNVTMTNTTGVNVGDYIYGQGIAYGSKVSSITNSTTVVSSIAVDSTPSGILIFSQLPNLSAMPSTGIKIKVRIKTTTTNTNAVTFLALHAQSTNTSRVRLYDQRVQYTLTLTGLISGSDISIRTAGVTGTNLVNVDANSGTTYAYTYYYSASTTVDFDIYKAGYKVAEVKSYLLTAANVSYPIQQLVDAEYA